MDVGITEKEKDILRLLQKKFTLTQACTQLGIAKQSGSGRMRRLKGRYQAAREFVDDYERWRSKLPGRYI